MGKAKLFWQCVLRPVLAAALLFGLCCQSAAIEEAVQRLFLGGGFCLAALSIGMLFLFTGMRAKQPPHASLSTFFCFTYAVAAGGPLLRVLGCADRPVGIVEYVGFCGMLLCAGILLIAVLRGACGGREGLAGGGHFLAGTVFLASMLVLDRCFLGTRPLLSGWPAGVGGVAMVAAAGGGFALDAARAYRERAALAESVAEYRRLLHYKDEQRRNMEETIRETRTLRHDLHHHLAVLRLLWERGDYPKLGEYLSAGQSRWATEIPTLENAAVDAVLQHFERLCRQSGIRLVIQAEPLGQARVQDLDLCSILSNLLENAVEACGQLPDEPKWIELSIKRLGDTLALMVKNSYDGLAAPKGPTFFSRKRGHSTEGHGIASIRNVCAKYGGNAEFEADPAQKTFASLVQLKDAFTDSVLGKIC